ncbi:MAG: 1-acyl-sn-glycerol-3-phosphate acyltransferase [Clostridiales bacterium]|jgi:1-acyl-sn-glycerol-3-phosphate acyltransferase|nr:1-acyl-sn-glycerol-3-phosphate acyltransferase [Clostridiales bacterium]
MRKIYLLFYTLLYPFFSLVYRTKAYHRERLPEGAALICANHSAYSDIILLAIGLGRKHFLRFVAKAELIKIPLFGFLIKKAGTIGIERGSSDVTAVRSIIRALKDGYKIALFPEGTRLNEDIAGSVKTGAIMIASRTGVPIVPVYIPRRKKLFSTVPVVIGEPYTLGKLKGGAEHYGTYADQLMSKINQLQKEL